MKLMIKLLSIIDSSWIRSWACIVGVYNAIASLYVFAIRRLFRFSRRSITSDDMQRDIQNGVFDSSLTPAIARDDDYDQFVSIVANYILTEAVDIVIVIGLPGTGKSSLTHFTAAAAAAQGWPRLPVVINGDWFLTDDNLYDVSYDLGTIVSTVVNYAFHGPVLLNTVGRPLRRLIHMLRRSGFRTRVITLAPAAGSLESVWNARRASGSNTDEIDAYLKFFQAELDGVIPDMVFQKKDLTSCSPCGAWRWGYYFISRYGRGVAIRHLESVEPLGRGPCIPTWPVLGLIHEPVPGGDGAVVRYVHHRSSNKHYDVMVPEVLATVRCMKRGLILTKY